MQVKIWCPNGKCGPGFSLKESLARVNIVFLGKTFHFHSASLLFSQWYQGFH